MRTRLLTDWRADWMFASELCAASTHEKLICRFEKKNKKKVGWSVEAEEMSRDSQLDFEIKGANGDPTRSIGFANGI